MKPTAALALLAATMLAGIGAAQQPAFDDRPKITVTGEAVVNVRPDRIVVTLGIESSDNDITLAKGNNSSILKRALGIVRSQGVAEKDIQTDHLSIEPRYGDNYRRESFLGYFVRNTLVITLDDPARVEGLVVQLLQAGVNYIHGVSFQTTELKQYREQARELALKAAKEKATKMAAVLGQSIGSPIQIGESPRGWGWNGSSWSSSSWGNARGSAMSYNVLQNIDAGATENLEAMALGTISIRAQVSVTFGLTH